MSPDGRTVPTARLRALLDEARASWPVAGAALCVVDRAGELLRLESGLADVAAATPVRAATRFEIGSISKSFTGMLIAQLAEQGLLRLSDPVVDHLPWFAVRSRFGPITLRSLLHHTSGLITGSDALPDARAHGYSLRDTETGSPPGALFHYSNVGYVLLGLVIERVTGEPLADVVRERLLDPLGMRASAGAITDDEHALLATGYQALRTDRPLLPGDPLIPATWLETGAADGNVAATASDLGRYARMLLGRGSLDGREVVSATCFERVVTDLAAGGEPSEYPSRYGLGTNTERIDGRLCLTHGGGMIGYSTFLAADVDAGVAVVALTNAPGEFPVGELIARRALAELGTGTRSGAPLDRLYVTDAARYAGKYTDGAHELTVRAGTGGELWLEADGEQGRLYVTGQDRLACGHPGYRKFAHRLSVEGHARRWTYGPLSLFEDGAEPQPRIVRPGGAEWLGGSGPTRVSPLVGHYRTYSPWYPSLRILQRGDRLVLVASVGVEAHTDEPELVPVSDGVYRIGADPRLPERVVCGPVVDGTALWIERDGCRYSRHFRD